MKFRKIFQKLVFIDKMSEEYIDIIDKNNNVIDRVPRSEMRKKNLRYRVSAVFVFNSRGEVLITKRTKTKDVYPGLYEIPGGALSSGESYEQNVIRELREELGIIRPRLKFLFDISYEDNFKKEIAKVYSCIYKGEIKPQKEEIESYFFISIDNFKKMIKEDQDKFCPDRLEMIKIYLKTRK